MKAAIGKQSQKKPNLQRQKETVTEPNELLSAGHSTALVPQQRRPCFLFSSLYGGTQQGLYRNSQG